MELVLGNSFGYTALSASGENFAFLLISATRLTKSGFFYGGFGASVTPIFGVQNSYGSDTAEYNDVLGFFVLMWTVLNLFFLFGSLPINLVYISVFFFVELAFAFIAASYFATADGKPDTAIAIKKAGGVFAFLAGILGYYTVAHLMCQTGLFFRFPMGHTNKYFVRKTEGVGKQE